MGGRRGGLGLSRACDSGAVELGAREKSSMSFLVIYGCSPTIATGGRTLGSRYRTRRGSDSMGACMFRAGEEGGDDTRARTNEHQRHSHAVAGAVLVEVAAICVWGKLTLLIFSFLLFYARLVESILVYSDKYAGHDQRTSSVSSPPSQSCDIAGSLQDKPVARKPLGQLLLGLIFGHDAVVRRNGAQLFRSPLVFELRATRRPTVVLPLA